MSKSMSIAIVVFLLGFMSLLHCSHTADPSNAAPSFHQHVRSLQVNECRITTTFLGFNFDDDKTVSGTTWVPPNPQGAAGASRLVAVGNSMMEVRYKNGTFVFRDDFTCFFSSFSEASDLGATFSTPKVIYDEHAGRFVIAVLQERNVPVLPAARIWLAVSKDETPDSASDWNQFFIDSIVSIGGNNARADYPGLEVDEEAVYLTANMRKFSDDSLAGVRLWVVTKGAVNGFYAGQTPTFYITNPYSSEGIATTTVPAQVHGSNGVDGSVGTFFPSILTSAGSVDLQIYTLFNPLGASPTSSIQKIGLGVITQTGPFPLAPQLGTTVGIDAGDVRVLDAVWQNNTLWVVFTINPNSGVNQGQTTAHWARLGTSGGMVTLQTQGDFGGDGLASGTFTYYPSVAVNTKGVVAYGYSASSPTTYAGAYVSTNYSDFSYTVKSGLAPYNRVRAGKNRWGEYTGISVDPTDNSFWVFNQYAEAVGSSDSEGDGRWGTVWGRLDCSVRFLSADEQRGFAAWNVSTQF
jgi:hypothetical protein